MTMTKTKKVRIVEIEDRGQDFTEFHVNGDNVIIDTKPFQAWVWNGFRIQQTPIEKGMRLRLRKDGRPNLTLIYPVIAIRRAA